MKYRESGMPNEQLWDTFFNPAQILSQLDINGNINTLMDIGCGYGTFLIPSAKLVKNKVIGIDIENEMIETCMKKIEEQNIKNIDLLHGDISTEQTIKDLEKYKGEFDYICFFNILPSMEIRPTPEVINGWALKSGFVLEKYVELPPYHYGMVFIKKS